MYKLLVRYVKFPWFYSDFCSYCKSPPSDYFGLVNVCMVYEFGLMILVFWPLYSTHCILVDSSTFTCCKQENSEFHFKPKVVIVLLVCTVINAYYHSWLVVTLHNSNLMSRTSMARTPTARLPRLFWTCSWDPRKKSHCSCRHYYIWPNLRWFS